MDVGETMRLALLTLVVLPLVLPVAVADATYQLTASAPGRSGDEYHLGDTITFRFIVRSVDESIDYTPKLQLYLDGAYKTGMDGARVNIGPGERAIVTFTWDTSTAPDDWAGPWEARVDKFSAGWATRAFDLSYTPDFELTYLDVAEESFYGFPYMVEDGTKKVVTACIENSGAEPAASVRVGLYFRTPVDPFLSGQVHHHPHKSPDWRQAHVVQEAVVDLTQSGERCGWPHHPSMTAGGYFVQFTWDATDDVAEASALTTRVGVRANVDGAHYELDTTNNEAEVEATVQPLQLLP